MATDRPDAYLNEHIVSRQKICRHRRVLFTFLLSKCGETWDIAGMKFRREAMRQDVS